MYCPVCRCEYLEGVTVCSDCNVALIDALPPEEILPSVPRLEQATLLAIIGFLYIFLVKTANTFFPGLFTTLIFAQVNSVLFLLARLTALYFFICFLREYVRPGQTALRTAVLLTILGELALTFLNVFGVVAVFGLVGYKRIGGVSLDFLAVAVPLAAGAFILYYFFVMRIDVLDRGLGKLKKATDLALIGSGVFLLIYMAALLNYFAPSILEQAGFWGKIFLTLLVGMPAIFFATYTMLNFFIVFYKELKTPAVNPGSIS